MGIVIHYYLSPYSFVMGVLWFNLFVLLGLLMRKLRFPVKFSAVPLLLLLVLSVLRMFIAIEIPGAIIVLSEEIYPAIINFARTEIVSHRILGLPVNVVTVFVLIWVTGAAWLIVNYLYSYIIRCGSISYWFERCERDFYAESLLAEMIGRDERFRVYRNGALSMAGATAIKPYIVLPKIDFPPDELRAVLLHEWKHIRDKDYLVGLVARMISFIFWWNPLVYVFRRNVFFAQELKCDQFAVSQNKSLKHFLRAILLVNKSMKEERERYRKYQTVNTLISDNDEIVDRLEVLALQGKSRTKPKRILYNAFYSVVIFALFFASYMFTVIPAFWESPDVVITTEDLIGDYQETGGIFRVEETFLVDNGDGTFSLYVDGQFVMYTDITNENINWFPIRDRHNE